MSAVNPASVRTIAEAIQSVAAGNQETSLSIAQAVLAYLRCPKHLAVVFFSLPEPIVSVNIYAVSIRSNAMLAAGCAQARGTAVLRDIISADKACMQAIQLEFEGRDVNDKVIATAPGVGLDDFLLDNEFSLLAPLSDHNIDTIKINYIAKLEV